jgi:WD40 repeat protein
MSWPLPQDFNEAVQSPGLAFLDPELKGGQAVVGAQGLPLPRSGNFADVYQVRTAAGRDFAVKCFTRPVVGLDHRYEQVGRALAKANLPFAVEFAYLTEGIRVGGAWRPVVKMDWVDGLQLNQFVRENAGKPAVLDALLQMWVRLCRRLRDAGIAHADLQHGNVLLVPGSKPGALTLKLIDYDGMYVPALANKPSGETGHACYQHPHRAAKRVYSQDLDRFPHLVVAAALQGLIAVGPNLWDRYDTGDNLLFQEADFKNPAASALVRELWECGDPAARALVGHLALACRKPIPQTPWLDQVAPDGAVTPLAGSAAKAAAEALGFTQPVTASSGWEEVREEPAAESPFAAAEVERPRAGKHRPAKQSGGGSRMLVIGGAVVVAVGVVVGAVVVAGGKKPHDETAQAGTNEKKDDPPSLAPKDDRKDRKDDRKDKGKLPTKAPGTAPPDRPTETNPEPAGNNPPPVVPVAADGPPLDADPAGAPVLAARCEARTAEPASVVRFAADGQLVAVAEAKGTRVRVVSARTGADASVFTGHTAPPVGVVPVRGGLFVSYAPGEDNFLEWSPQTGALARRIKAPPNFLPVGAHGMLDASPDGRYLVIARLPAPDADPAEPGELKVLDTPPTGPEVRSVKAYRPRPLFTPDGDVVRVADRNSVQRYKLPSGGYDGGTTFNPATKPAVIAGSPDGSKYLYTPDGRRLQVLEGHAARMVERLPPRFHHPEAAAAFSPDGRLLAACTSDPGGASHLEVIDLTDRRVVGRLPLSADGAVDVTAVAFSADGKSVAVGRSRGVQFVELAVAAAAAPAPPAVAANPNPDPNPAPAVPAADPPAGEVPEFRERWSVAVDPKVFGVIRYDRAGRFVVLSHHNRLAAYPFDARTGKAGQPWLGGPEGRQWHLLPMSGSKFAFAPYFDDAVYVWDAATDNASTIKVPPVPEIGGMRTRMTVKVSPDGRFVAASRASPGIEPGPAGQAKPQPVPLQVTDVKTGKAVVALNWLSGSVHFTPDSARVLVVDATARFRWFKLPSGQPDGEWTYEKEPSYYTSDVQGMSARGDTLVYHGAPPGKLDSYYLLDGRTGKVIKSFTPKTYHGSFAAISDDGGVIAFVRNDGFGVGHTVEVFHAPGRLVGKVKIPAGPRGHEGATIALSPDGRSLVMHNRSDHKLTTYDLPPVDGAVAVRPPVNPDPAPKVNPAPAPEATPRPAAADRLAAPAGDALAKAEANVRTVLKDDYARKQPGEKKTLAQKLITLADGTTDDPAARYVMLRDARDLAAEVGDPQLAAQAIDALAKWYEIDPAAAKLAALEKILSASSSTTTLKAVNELAAAGADAAFDADDYAGAARLAQAAATAARKGGLGPAAIEDADFRLAHLKKTRDAFDAAQPALERLKAAPDDPDANLVVGKFRCFVQGRWADGVKLLAKGSGAPLKQVAELELAAPPAGPADVKVADAWWDFAQAAPDVERRAAEARARYWYVRAVPGLMGLARAKVEGRLGFTHNNVEYKPGLLAEFTSKQPVVLKGKKARIDAVIDYSAAEFVDGARTVDVTVKWTGVILPPRPGRYKLVASGADPVRVRVDGKTLIDTIVNRNGKREGSVLLPDRPAQLVVEFTSPNTATHTLRLSWVPAGGAEEAVPAEALFHDRKAEAALGK